jgi:hypothetical protein
MNMKRAACHVALAALLLGLPASHLVWSQPDDNGNQAEKVLVCHIQGKEKGPDGPVDRETGVIIEVSQVAAEHHLAHHRDCVGKDVVLNKDGSCSCNSCGSKCNATHEKCVAACAGDKKCIAVCDAAQDKCRKTCDVESKCTLKCEAVLEQCTAGCDGDANCIANCQTGFNKCVAVCKGTK